MKWYVTGDTHAQFQRFKAFHETEAAVLILGDVGLNYHLNKKDFWTKKGLTKMCPNITFYCVKGNHEARPSEVKGMELVYDEEVQGEVWFEKDYPKIKYFKEWGTYVIDGHKTLVIGGAYSVDKWVRLSNDWNWFPSEQLTDKEQEQCFQEVQGKAFDLVLTHTCPFSWRPTDLFVSGLNNVDYSMELFLEKVKQKINWGIWLFGHFHEDRVEKPHAELLFTEIQTLDFIFKKWNQFDTEGKLDWTIPKSPTFYWGV